MNIYDFIHSWGRICLQCGSFRAEESLFCKSCETQLTASAQPKPLNWPVRGDFIYGLAYLTWIPNENRPLSLLIGSLKGGRVEKAWEFWARQMLVSFPGKFSTLITKDSKAVVIPAPASKEKMKDHALVFAQSLEKLTGWEVKNCLHKDTSQSQKGLGKLERQLIELSSSEIFSDETAVIFVDDVATTGATAKAAYLALGRPKKFFVLTLAYRQAGASGCGDI